MNKWDCPVELKEICFGEACKYIKDKFGIDVTEARLRRWANNGLVSHSGHRVFLQARKRASWAVCRRFIDDFFRKQAK